MRKSKKEAAATRVSIVEAASAEFRRRGIEQTGLNDLMGAAGLTRGGFYKHFTSKDQVVAEACATAAGFLAATLAAAAASTERDGFAVVTSLYLSKDQRDKPSASCPLATMGSELARGDGGTRAAATDGFLKLVEVLATVMLEPHSEKTKRRAATMVAAMVGALTMSRIVTDPQLSDAILEGMNEALFCGRSVQ